MFYDILHSSLIEVTIVKLNINKPIINFIGKYSLIKLSSNSINQYFPKISMIIYLI